MASADYYACDLCGGKAFYAADLEYGEAGLPGRVGAMKVLCLACSVTYEVIVQAKPPSALAPAMSREEFIAAYVARSRVTSPSMEPTPTGFRHGDRERVALRCRCGEDCCEGWAMVNNDPEDIAEHERLYPADAAEPLIDRPSSDPVKDGSTAR